MIFGIRQDRGKITIIRDELTRTRESKKNQKKRKENIACAR